MLICGRNEKIDEPCALLLGGFDGLHVGHETLLSRARETGLPVGITAITNLKAGGDLFTLAEREHVFQKEGVLFVVELPFEEIKDISAAQFLADLFANVRAEAVFCGADFRFGKDAAGSAEFLQQNAPCPVEICPIQMRGGKKVSITEVKEFLGKGDLPAVNSLLSGGYFVQGVVEHGRQVGRTYGFPTANVSFPAEKYLLREGVYRGYVETDGKTYSSIVNVGARPTFGVEQKKIEAYLHRFDGDLYGKIIRIYPTDFVRPIVKFASVEELKSQLKKDLETL